MCEKKLQDRLKKDRELRKNNKKRYMNGWDEYFQMHRNRTLNPKQYGSKGPSKTDSSAGPVNRGRDWYGK